MDEEKRGLGCRPQVGRGLGTSGKESPRRDVVEPELGYVLKLDPHLMNSGWAARDKDRADIEVLRALLADRHVDLGALPGWVKSV